LETCLFLHALRYGNVFSVEITAQNEIRNRSLPAENRRHNLMESDETDQRLPHRRKINPDSGSGLTM
jgi:hypothetical protein